MTLVVDVGLLDKAHELKESGGLSEKEDDSVFDAQGRSPDAEISDLPDLSGLDLESMGELSSSELADDLSAPGEESAGESVLSELSSIPERFSSESAEIEHIDSSDLLPLPSDDFSVTDETLEPSAEAEGFDARSAGAEEEIPVPASAGAEEEESPRVSPEAEETYIPSSDEVPFPEEKGIPELLISDSDLLPDENEAVPAGRMTPPFTLSDDDLVITDEPEETALVEQAPEAAFQSAPDQEPTQPEPSDRTAVLWEAAREIVKSTTQNDFFNVLILLAMGHLEASTASVIVPVKGEEQNKWILRDSRGTRLSSKAITFRPADRIMSDIIGSDRIIDIERYASDSACLDEYNLFLSIDARLAVPLRMKERVNAVFILGNKLSGDEFSAADLAFAADLCALASPVYDRIVLTQRLSEENAAFEKKGTEAAGNESLEKQLLLYSDSDAGTLIQERLRAYGIDSYAFFSRTEQGEAFYPVFAESGDLITFRSTGFTVQAGSEFCQYLLRACEWEEFENPGTSEMLKKLFGDQLILKMNIFIAVPFIVRGHLAGFMLALRARRDILSENTTHASRFIRMVLRHILLCESVYVDDARFVDSVSRVFRRLERCIEYAAGLRIPVAAIVFSVRNIKRYCALYGASEGEELVRRFRSIIETRLSSSEFAVRTDRGKILVLLPGKTKKYAVPFANAVRNELSASYKDRESQIMLTFMTGEYPADGKNIHELLDYLD